MENLGDGEAVMSDSAIAKIDRSIRAYRLGLSRTAVPQERRRLERMIREAQDERKFLTGQDSGTEEEMASVSSETDSATDSGSDISFRRADPNAELPVSEPGSSPDPRIAQYRLRSQQALDEAAEMKHGSREWHDKMDEVRRYSKALERLIEAEYGLERQDSDAVLVPSGGMQKRKPTIPRR